MDIFTANPNPNSAPKFTTPRLGWHKILFLILGIIVLIEVIYAVRSLASPPPLPVGMVDETVLVPKEAKFSLKSPQVVFKAGEIVPVVVEAESGGQKVLGADLIIKFDPEVLDVAKTDIEKGTLFDDYPLVSVNTQKGLVSISGISNKTDGVAVSGQFAAINFKAKIPGKTFLTIDFEQNSTTHSNLVEALDLKNILKSVDNLEIEIQ